MSLSLIPPSDFNAVVTRLRSFFQGKGFVEVHTQNRLSILAACEDPKTVATYNYPDDCNSSLLWPLPQTGQMWLEYELLKNPSLPGVFCVSTSYRNEPNPVPGRHLRIFPMFEFESHGTMEDLIKLEKELVTHLGFKNYLEVDYQETAKEFNVKELENQHEEELNKKSNVVFIENFPEYTSPFWNMKRSANTAKKVDVIIHGMETIGSAERSCDKNDMKNRFDTISNGEYAQLLYNLFTKERVQKEMEEFLNLNFIPRYGGGIGITRLIRGMKLSKII